MKSFSTNDQSRWEEEYADLVAATFAVNLTHLSGPPRVVPSPPNPATIDSLANETLDRIFELVAEPMTRWDHRVLEPGHRRDLYGTPEPFRAAREAAFTLLSVSRVSKRWKDLVGRIIEQHCCIQAPITSFAVASSTCQTRCHQTKNMFLTGRHESKSIPSLAKYWGVTRLHMSGPFGNSRAALESPVFEGLTELLISDGCTQIDDPNKIMPNASRLTYLCVDSEFDTGRGGLLACLLLSAKASLEDLNIHTQYFGYALHGSFLRVQRLAIQINVHSTFFKSYDKEFFVNNPLLAGFPSLKTLELSLEHYQHPVMWTLSRKMVDHTIATLPPSVRLSQLTLPTGKLSSLDSITPYLDHPALHELEELLFPNINRDLLDDRGFGRELLAMCERRGVRVVCQEELALLRAVR